MLQRKRLAAAALSSVALVASALAVSAWAGPSADVNSVRAAGPATVSQQVRRPRPRPKIVQMGDSYSSGNGAGSYIENNCWRSTVNYGALVAERLEAKYDNVACSGGVVKDLLEARALGGPQPRTATYTIDPVAHPDQQAEWRRIAERQQLCGAPTQKDMYFTYDVSAFAAVGDQATATASCQLMTEPQIKAVNPSTDLVFMTIGGNDIGFTTIVVQCLVARAAAGCETTIAAANAKVAEMKDATKTAAVAVHKRSKGRAEIYLIGYPFLINTDNYSIPEAAPTYNAGAGLHALQVNGDQAQAQGVAELNASTPGSDFHFVDVKPAWGQHAHGMDPRAVPDQSQSWIVPPFAPGSQIPEWVHPAPAGWVATAEALYAAITG